MKKFFTLLLLGGAALTVPVMAQEEDMTHLIVNAGFDEDPSFDQLGHPTKDLTATGRIADSRGEVYEAEDGSMYTKPIDSKDHVNNFGEDSWYGFVATVKGWTYKFMPKEDTEANRRAPAWVYFGAIPYAIEDGRLGLGDGKPAGSVASPGKPDEDAGEDNTSFLLLRAGWANGCTYSQEVLLPTAEYRLEYWTKNINANSTASATNLSKVSYRTKTYADDGGVNDKEWTKHMIEFVAVGKMTMTFGYKAANDNSNKNPWIVIDGIKLYKIGEADEKEIIQGDANEYAEDAYALAQDSLAENFGQAYDDVYDEIAELQNSMDDVIAKGGSVDELNAIAGQLRDMKGKIRTLIAEANKALEIYYYIQDKILPYYDAIPGYNDLNGYFNGINMAQVTAAEIPTLADEMKAKLAAFWQSQSATREQPAIYSYLVSSPWFCKPYREPANRDAIAEAGLTSEDLNSDGWVVGSQSGSEHKLYWAYDRTAFQLWNTNFTGYLDVHQELTNIPNGVYSLEADLVTNANARSDQHIYATSTLQETKGYMTDAAAYESWQSGAMPEDVPWETVQTAGTVIVMDGKLTIGARSTQQHYNVETGEYDEEPDMSSGARRGSFWMTNFVLRYHGEATPDEIAAAKAALLQKATTLNADMHFAADKASVADSIAEFNTTQNVYVLNGGIALAERSEAKYVEIMGEGKTIPTVRDSLEKEGERYGIAYDIVKYAYDKTMAWVEGQDATYAKADSILNVMKGYSNSYAAVCSTASKVIAAISSEQGKNAITSLMADQKSELLAGELLTPEAVDKMVKSLNNVLEVAQAQDTYEKNKDNTDFTSYIKNAAGESADGWTVISKGNGPTNSSEYYNNNESGRKYFDSWAAKDLDFTVEQVINNLPNGTYAMKAAIRTDRTEEGSVKLFTANGGEEKTDTTYYMVPNQWKHLGEMERTDGTINPDSVVFCSNIYGAIWEAVDPICREHISEATEEQLGIWNANGGKGFGWQWINISDIKVENHKLVIGFTSNSNRTGVAFTGSWFSVADFSLTLLEKGDNTGWDGPITGISETPSEQRATAIDGIYTLSGARVQKAQRGLYIIVQGGKSRKVIMK